MKLNIKKLESLVLEEMGALILEQGEDEDEAKETAGDEAGETTSGEEGDAGKEKEGAVEPEEEPDEEPDEEPEKEKIDLEPDDVFSVGKEIDLSLEKVLADFETRALKSAALEDQMRAMPESLSLKKALLEAPATPDIDVSQFAGDVARLINNYQNLLDLEAIIYNKAQDYLLDKYGETVSADFVDMMSNHFNISFSKDPVEKSRHYAVTGNAGDSDVGYTGGGGD